MVSILLGFGGYKQHELKVPYVTIRPTNERWNDFGYNFHAAIKVVLDPEKPPLELGALIVPVDGYDAGAVDLASNFNVWLHAKIKESQKAWIDPEVDLEKNVFPPFVTLLNGESSYRSLAEHLPDIEQLIEILRAINDLVFLGESEAQENFLYDVTQSKKFQLGVMRTGSAFRALHRGRKYLHGNFAHVKYSDARQPLTFGCKLSGYHGEHSLQIAYQDNAVIADRIHCLIGRNGTGKSRLLRELILKLGSVATGTEKSTPFTEGGESYALGETSYLGPEYLRVIAISSDAESIFPSAVRVNTRYEYQHVNLHRREPHEIGTVLSTRQLVDLMRGEDNIGEKSRWHIFRDALDEYVDMRDLHLPVAMDADNRNIVSSGGSKWVAALTLKTIGEQAALELYGLVDFSRELKFFRSGQEVRHSSGERMYFRFALNLLSYIDVASVLVIDEPETHLHPNLICDFVNLLYEVLNETKSIALIATHSAYVIREVPSHCAHIYSVDKNRVPSEGFVYLKTLGASVESISQAIFSDSNAKKFHRQIVRSMANEGKSLDDLIQAYAGFVSPEMLSQVAELLDQKENDWGERSVDAERQ